MQPFENTDRLTAWLRRLYAAPASPVYWRGLESRIMARIAEAELAWWGEFERWGRPAMIAAAALILAAGAMMYRAHEADSASVYRELVTPAADQPSSDVAPVGPREATLRSIIAKS